MSSVVCEVQERVFVVYTRLCFSRCNVARLRVPEEARVVLVDVSLLRRRRRSPARTSKKAGARLSAKVIESAGATGNISPTTQYELIFPVAPATNVGFSRGRSLAIAAVGEGKGSRELLLLQPDYCYV